MKTQSKFTISLKVENLPFDISSDVFNELSKVLNKYKLGSYLLKNSLVESKPCPKCGSSNCDDLLASMKEFIKKKELEKDIHNLRTKPKVRRR